MRCRLNCRATAALTVVLIAAQVSSQTTTSGGLSGVVVDQTGAVVPDTLVEISDISKGTSQSVNTDGSGAYQFPFLRPGKYTLKVQHAGFQAQQTSLAIQVGPSATANITLQVAHASSQIVVSGE